jgi:glyoxylase-like metal-dependent hydrolase (beta-lactamase superfamily II)
MQFGCLRLDLVSGGRFRLDGATLFGVVPRPLWERRFPPDASNRVGLAAHCLLVRGAGFAVLIETGLGDKWEERGRALHGIESRPGLEEGLAALGVRAEEIDAVVVSDLRFDHSGGATRREGGRLVPSFAHATLSVQEAELAHARAPDEHTRDRAAYRPENWEPYAETGRLAALSGVVEIRPGVTVVPLSGHSGGKQAVRIHSEGKTAFAFGDVLPTAAHVPIPWIREDDRYPVERIAQKKRLLDGAAAEGWLCVFENDPDVPWGTIVDELNGRRRVHPVRADSASF